MASTTKLISEEQFLCSICQEVFKEPVSTRCGHNFCKSCITEYWDSTCQIQCPLCRTKFYRRPKFFVNTEFRDMVEHFRHMKVIKGKAEGEIAKPGDVPCDVCTETKMKAHKTCVVCLASYCQTHLELHQNLKAHKLVSPLSNLWDKVCKKHDKMLELFCCTDQKCVCLICWKDGHADHDVILLEKASQEKKALLAKSVSEMKIIDNQKTVEVNKLKASFQQTKKESMSDLADVEMALTSLVADVQEHKRKVIELIQQKQKRADAKGDAFFAQVVQESVEMRKKIHKLEQLLQTDDHLHFLLNYPSYYQTAKSTQPNPTKPFEDKRPIYKGMVKKSTAQMRKTLSSQIEGLLYQVSSEDCEGEGGNTTMPEVWIPPQDELMMIQQCNAVDLTLNAFGAHPSLMVSSDGKHLSLRNGRFVLSSFFGARIEHLPIAYSTNFFSSGRFYYEVQVNRSQNFFLGVAKESMKVNPPFIPSPEDGVWIFRHTFGRYHTNGRHPDLILRQAPNVIGVFVDYEKGEVSFYDVEGRYVMFSFRECYFAERASFFTALLYSMTGMSEITRPKLYPIFGVFDDGSDPSLTITPVNFTVEDASFVEGN
ncbi:E3 ubiquitin-protein ligase TRIM39 isoform X2 [Oryzias melastigma]|nr:E3 ubiquitin-protein ligase TRIM39 isoform X2 [Oryzias melastigma]